MTDFDCHAADLALDSAEREFKFLGKGHSRTTFAVGGGLVLKIQHSPCFCAETEDNPNRTSCQYEAESFDRLGARYPLAECVLVEYAGVEALLMEAVKVSAERWTDYLPRWAAVIDSQQVGRNAAGKLVAYDYGNDIDIERLCEAFDSEN